MSLYKMSFRKPRALIIAAATLVFMAALAVSYSDGLYLVFGILIAWPLALVLLIIVNLIRKYLPRRRWARGLLMLALTFTAPIALTWALNAYSVYRDGPCASLFIACSVKDPGVSSHNVVVTVDDLDANTFNVSEAFAIEPGRGQLTEENTSPTTVELPAKRITGEPSGLFLKRLKIPGPSKRTLSFQGPDGKLREVDLCGYYCNEVSVTLKEFPRKSFYAANTTQGLTIPDYPGDVTMSWTIPSVYSGRSEDILIWYHPSKSTILTTLLRPFAGITSFGGFVWALLGVIGTLIITPFVSPAISDLVKEKLKSLFPGEKENQKDQKTKNTKRKRGHQRGKSGST